MNNISQHVGAQIRYFRKLRGYSLSDFASRINKSTSTLSKYESGSISIDIMTLSDVASALDVTLAQLLPPSYETKPLTERDANPNRYSKNFFSSQDIYYVYYYFPLERNSANKGLSISVIEITRKNDEPDEVYFYNECQEPNKNYKNCKYVFHGSMLCYDFIAYFMLENVFHVGCHDYICAKVPFTQSSTTTGLYVGISQSLRNPAATKVIVSKSLLNITDETLNELMLNNKEINYDLKKRNTLLIR